jgi:YggT family protein
MRIEEKSFHGTLTPTGQRAARMEERSMTVPPTPPPDREEHVEVVRQPGAYQQRRVVHNAAAEQRATVARVTQIIWLLFGFLQGLIALRIVLRLIGANPDTAFVQLVYGITSIFLWPFAGITPDPGYAQYQLEVSSIIAMIVYALLAWGLVRLVWVLFYRPETSAVESYREDRY